MDTKPTVRRSFCRRHFFRGLGAASLIATPLLRAHTARAAGQPQVILVYVGGGMRRSLFQQTLAHGARLDDSPLAGALGAFDQPDLKALKSHLTVVDNVYLRWGKRSGRFVDAHQVSAVLSLVAAYDRGTRVSLDRVLGEKLGGALFPSVRLKIIRGIYDHSTPSTGGSASLSKSFGAATEAYDGLFRGGGVAPAPSGGTGAPAAPGASSLAFRRDVLGGQLEECRAVVAETERQLGKEVAARVRNHCDSLREMELRLEAFVREQATGNAPAPASGGGKCPPERPAFGAATFTNLPQALDVYTPLAVNALACRRTRVVLYELWTDQPQDKMAFLRGFESQGMHGDVFHGSGAAAPALGRLLVDKFGRMVKLASDLGLLEDTAILWTTNEPNGSHNFDPPAPFFYAGKGGGRLVTGRYLKPGAVGVNDLYTSLLRGIGMDIARFGDDNSGRERYGADDLILT
jgi:hypothetical protein